MEWKMNKRIVGNLDNESIKKLVGIIDSPIAYKVYETKEDVGILCSYLDYNFMTQKIMELKNFEKITIEKCKVTVNEKEFICNSSIGALWYAFKKSYGLKNKNKIKDCKHKKIKETTENLLEEAFDKANE